MKQPKAPLSFNLRPEIISELRRISGKTGIPMTRLIEDSLINYLPSVRAAHADQLEALARLSN
jgi:hypothetical protein